MSDELDDREWAILIREALDEPGTVPVQVLEAARAAFTWRTIDADLAEITFDSRAGDVWSPPSDPPDKRPSTP